MDWEWRNTNEESSKSLQFPGVLPDNDEDYGGRVPYDDEEPLIRLQFRAENAPLTLRSTIRTAYFTRKAKYPLTDANGDSWNGYVTGYRFEPIAGCDRMNCELELTQVITDLTEA